MSRLFVLGIASALMFGLGCSTEEQTEPAMPAAASEDAVGAEANEAFAELSAEDREAAMAQKVCPVSDQELGSMGTPIKVTVDGRDVFVCCESCVEELKSNFDEYAAKLDNSD